MIDYKKLVQDFHDKYGHYNGKLGVTPSSNVIELRSKLITEEAIEFADESSLLAHGESRAIVEVADAIADLLYVTFGAAIAYGIPIEEVFLEVHRSNMTKSVDKNVYGKTIKGVHYEPPKLHSILFKDEK